MILNVFNIMSPFIDCDVTADNKSLHDRLREKQDERDSDRTLHEIECNVYKMKKWEVI
jgi:hypothetical protein